jgi:hypothetical protein
VRIQNEIPQLRMYKHPRQELPKDLLCSHLLGVKQEMLLPFSVSPYFIVFGLKKGGRGRGTLYRTVPFEEELLGKKKE